MKAKVIYDTKLPEFHSGINARAAKVNRVIDNENSLNINEIMTSDSQVYVDWKEHKANETAHNYIGIKYHEE